ncbi:SMC family ATPase [Bacillus sp. Bva_UNVM-123]|uniref:AAA family ATPase n=1 Tax=Bacillus sp. Bva_UNVM-123 TaxID=2829798 RepID=UPI00391F393E
MRPLKLTLQAFGPYAEKEEIDFTLLGNRTMFVISGKTGSGKTTIFDGISYAIYGKASGEDRTGSDLRSQFAKDETITEISLLFSIRNKTYFITRAPQQEKRKERGTGFRTIHAKAELYIIDDMENKQLLAANVRDVDEKIKEIMIIDSNQFRQILMIPQGEFRKLLTSESKDKEIILQRLFHTEIFKRIEEKLKEDSGELKKSVEKQVEKRHDEIRRIHALFNDELKNNLEAGHVNDNTIISLLEAEVLAMNGELSSLSNKLKDKKDERDTLQQKVYEAEAIVKQLTLLDELEKRKTELETEKDDFLQTEKQIKLAQKAALLAQQEELCHHLKRELDGANEELVSLRIKVSTLIELLSEHEAILENEMNCEDERRNASDEVSRLQNMKTDIHSLSIVQNEVDDLEKRIHMKKRQKSQLEEFIQGTEAKLKELMKEKERLEEEQLYIIENTHKLEKLETNIDRINKYVNQRDRKEKALVQLEERQKILQQFSARLADTKNLVEHLEQKWFHGQASILAHQLRNGEACPVCGSEHHPMPASTIDHMPNEEDVRAAKQQLAQIEKDKTAAQSAYFESQSTARSLHEAVEEQFQLLQKEYDHFHDENLTLIRNSIMLERTQLADKQRELVIKQEKRFTFMQEQEAAEKAKTENEHLLMKIVDDINELTILFTEKKTNLKRIIENIPEELRLVSAYEARMQQAINYHKQLVKKLEIAQKNYQDTKGNYLSSAAKCELIEKQVEKLNDKLRLEKSAFIQRMHDQGFDGYSQYNEAKRTEEKIHSMEKLLRNYREEVRSVNDRYEELNTILMNVEKPDIEKLMNLFKDIDNHINCLQDEYTNLYIKMRDNEEIKNKIMMINEKLKVMEERYKIVGELYDITKGQNPLRITYERFVLAAFLDDILREANVRLRKMTSSRFELLRKTERSKGNVQSGLELLVYDQYTGQERHVKTLSGGESFKAALALALGLSDVVQEYAGGVSLETMFIDEGFGTLDPESLDQAIEALMDIQSSGRLVGIISHVPELKERIEARLEVTATQTGSKTEFLFLS